ncbi:ATP-dependent helicase/deoxyribonuclease subunit B [Paraliobacillus quinghaiensis]|uniref:ATP-dependent helicase/deoxyribonuclease subunit B n=1 Tax=Paraliobacillus quinghaiensis TaxID=470815 RepID=A0A917TJ68_9BACI|nr:helicase-exonuclease AddAB subunit AddB [Paraliobacillus quinghaiensis]GGM25196.1 ATP-dependent helicase/deoxyribonuclease subunit B [Paraliobacillus quinghaiensis]
MGIRFLVGNATVSKSTQCLDEIKQSLEDDPQGSAIIYLVPDQMTFQQEYALLQGERVNGSIRAQVFSFSRLAWRVLQETGGATKQFVSSTGVQMMLRKIIEEHTSDWKMFQKSIEKKGFIEQMERVITEFKRYCVTPDLLQIQIAEMDRFHHLSQSELGLKHKLEDLHYIYENLANVLYGQYIDNEDQLALLAEKIPQTSFLDDATIYIDGFHRFTPQEQQVIAALMEKTDDMTIALTLDQASQDEVSSFDLFSQTKETYHVLTQIAGDIGLNVKTEVIPTDESDVQPYFAHLEKHFETRPAPAYQGEAPIQIAQAVHPRAEVEGTAQEILRLVREEGYRYQDMVVLVRETDVYHDLIATIFEDYQIPAFIDEKRTMLHHPLIELIRSALDVVVGNWRYDAVFRLLKTGLIPAQDKESPLDADAIDTLENYVLEYGIRGRNQWLGDNDWIFQRFRGFDHATQTDQERKMQQQINRYRKQVVEALEPLEEGLHQAETVEQKAVAIYTWLEALQIPVQLEKLRDKLDDTGKIEAAREQEQVWDAIMQLLDEMVEIIGNENISLQLFQQSLETGFETLKFAHVPPSIDHIVIGTIDRSRVSGIKAAFLLGVNEGTWPMKPSIDGVLSEEDRSSLQEHGMQLADGERQQLLDDWFYVYLACTVASDRIWVSYLLSDAEGKAKMPSTVIKRIQDLFPACSEPVLLQDPEEMTQADRFVTTPAKTKAALTAQLAKYQRGYPVEPIWWSVFNWFVRSEKQDSKTSRILQSLFYQNSTTNLSKDTIEELYPKQIKASVSRMEMYHRCSYQHFAQYSLGLQERQTYKLDAPDIGQLFHEALRQITEWIQGEGKAFNDIYQEDATQYATRAVEKLAPILQHQILHSSNRYHYMKTKLERIIARATYVLSEQSRKSDFSPIGLEMGFGLPKSELDPLQLQLPNGYELVLRGRIDRVDKATLNEALYLRIIDYKSSAKGLNLVEVYYGLALQMLAYLDVILSNSENWLGLKATPAGVLYFHVHNPMLSESKALNEQSIEEKLFKKFKMQGLLMEDENVLQKMDTDLDTGMSSIVPAGLKKDGTFRSGSQIATSDTFNDLQGYVRQLMTEAGVDISNGGVTLNPYQQKQQTACTYCAFRSVCQFDATLPENNYRRLQALKDDEVLQKMKEKGEL